MKEVQRNLTPSKAELTNRNVLPQSYSLPSMRDPFPERVSRFLKPGRVGSTPAESRSDLRKNRLHDVHVVLNAQLIRDRQQKRIRFGDSLVFPELLDERVGFGRVTPPENRPRGWIEKTNPIGLLLV